MELKRETKVECWISSQNQEEIHFFIEDTKYLFGFNPKLISRSKIAEFLSDLGYAVDPKEWVDK